MTVTFSPEMEQEISHEARARGIAPDEFVRQVVAREVRSDPSSGPLQLTVDEFLAELNRIGRNLPVLPEQAYMRESFYEGHD